MRHQSDQPFPEYGRRRQELIFVHGLGHQVSRVPADFSVLEERARRVMTKRGFAYVAGGAGNERTMAANRAAFDRWRIVPRVLRDVSRRDLSLTLFGERLPTPAARWPPFEPGSPISRALDERGMGTPCLGVGNVIS